MHYNYELAKDSKSEISTSQLKDASHADNVYHNTTLMSSVLTRRDNLKTFSLDWHVITQIINEQIEITNDKRTT